MADKPRIFVNIASYRDTECQWTVRDLFEKAADPDRVFVGICWQFVPGEDDDCFQIETRPGQCRIDEVHAKESRGVCWARHRAQKLWRGEEYTLQIDAHMRFVPQWDRLLIDMAAECPSDKPVLTTYPIPYEPPDKLSPDAIVTIKPKHFDSHRIILFRSVATAPKDAPEEPRPSAFCAAGFLFASSGIITDAPYDPHLYFQGEEITLALRLWTRGWDMFSPNRVIVYHDYTNRPDRIRHWKDEVDWARLNNLSMARVRHLLGIERSDDPEVLDEIETYGLGRERSLAEYEAFSGLKFDAQTIDGKVVKAPPKPDADGERQRRMRMFKAIWEQNGWRCEETRSGHGATLAQTEVIRRRLPEVFRELDIRIVGDAGCGELNWMREISGALRLFMGFDIVPGLIDELRETFAERKTHSFTAADIVGETLPECDAIVCRDCLTHLTPDEVTAALARFKRSRSTYLIATTHVGGKNAEIKTGGWYPMDLTAEPFGLPEPRVLVDEELKGATKALGVWRISDIP